MVYSNFELEVDNKHNRFNGFSYFQMLKEQGYVLLLLLFVNFACQSAMRLDDLLNKKKQVQKETSFVFFLTRFDL